MPCWREKVEHDEEEEQLAQIPVFASVASGATATSTFERKDLKCTETPSVDEVFLKVHKDIGLFYSLTPSPAGTSASKRVFMIQRRRFVSKFVPSISLHVARNCDRSLAWLRRNFNVSHRLAGGSMLSVGL